MNLYGFVYNSAYLWVDHLGREPVLSFQVQRNDTISTPEAKKKASAAMKNWEKFLAQKLDECCKKFKLCCDTKIRIDDFNDKPSAGEPPQFGGYLPGEHLRFHAGEIDDEGNIPVLLTDGTVANGGIGGGVGLAAEGSGIIMDISAGITQPEVLAHELGHVGGYDAGTHVENGKPDPHHEPPFEDSVPEAERPLMAKKAGGRKVDECWCKKVSELIRDR